MAAYGESHFMQRVDQLNLKQFTIVRHFLCTCCAMKQIFETVDIE